MLFTKIYLSFGKDILYQYSKSKIYSGPLCETVDTWSISWVEIKYITDDLLMVLYLTIYMLPNYLYVVHWMAFYPTLLAIKFFYKTCFTVIKHHTKTMQSHF
jgi:hypothetical protein